MRVLRYLPKRVRYALIRRKLKIPRLPEGIEIRLAKDPEEVRQAARVLHDVYVETGLAKPDPTGARFTRFHSHPTAKILVAVVKGEVVGTVSFFEDTELGLPMDEIYSLSQLRRVNKLGEISCLAIKKRYRGRGAILFHFIKWIYIVSRKHVDGWVFSFNPKYCDLYDGIFCMKKVSDKVVSVGSVLGAPAVGRYLLFAEHEPMMKRMYCKAKPEGNVYQFVTGA